MTIFIQPVVLAGGAGTRLWPVSTEARPKHLLELLGSGTLLERTLARVSDANLFAQPMIVCAEPQAAEISALAPASKLILEPFPRGSAAAIAMAAEALGRDDLILVLPSDHNIDDPAPLVDAIRLALPSAQEGRLVTFGIKPTHAETGYGYIRSGEQLSEGVFEAQSFVEKPPQEVAKQLASSGSAFWNSGMFLFSAGALLDELERHAPDIRAATSAAMLRAMQEKNLILPNAEALDPCPATSIDYAVMEHSDRIVVVPLELDWSDVGSWAAVYDLSSKDAHGNVIEEGSQVLGGKGCLVKSTGPRIVAIGVDDLVIVATADHVLVVPRSEAQRVREAASLSDESSR